jgi:uncharacterized protein YbjT (DUF2867 family)
MILITGASGNAGGAVLSAAINLKLPVRAMYRSKEDAKNAPKGVDTVFADFADKQSLTNALQGIDSVYLVCGPIPQLVELEGDMIDACKTAGVKHILLNSALGAGKFNKSFPSWHAKVEQKLKASGVDYTTIRPNGFMQNIVTYNAASIKANHAFYAAMGDAKTSLIDVRDIGAVAARILSEPEKHNGKTYELNGPEAVSNAEVAERISRITGVQVSFVDIPEEAQRKAMLDMKMPQWQVTAILELQEYYRSGNCSAVDGTVQDLLGKPARTLDAYLGENKTAFSSKAA